MGKTKWVLDPAHSELQFKVKHLAITTVTGNFNDFSITAESEDDHFHNSNIQVGINTASIHTGNAQRDEHLRSADFFDANNFPSISFNSASVKPGSDGALELSGTLRIKDVEKPVSMKLEMAGIAKDPYGNTKAGFSLEGKINRKDFGLTWNVPIEAGMLVGEQVKILGEIQLVKEA